MTDNEIINNIIWCIDPKNACADCPYYELRKSLDCVSSLFRDTLDLINRQKADNKELQFRIDELQRKIVSCNSDILNEYKARIQVDEMVVCANSLGEWLEFCDNLKAEAIKEYMDKVISEVVNKPAKFKASEGTADFLSGMAHRQNQILDIIEEMAGVNDGSENN